MFPEVVLLAECLAAEVTLVGSGALGRVSGHVLFEPRWTLERLTAVTACQTVLLRTQTVIVYLSKIN